MNIAGTIILNLILITFPILIYFIYNCYRELKCEKYNNILLNLSLFTSLYFCFKYGGKDISKITLFANIPILLAYLKKEHKTAILVTHDLSEAVSMADRVLVLSKRPATVLKEVKTTFETEQRTPMKVRNMAGFKEYFNEIWEVLQCQ